MNGCTCRPRWYFDTRSDCQASASAFGKPDFIVLYFTSSSPSYILPLLLYIFIHRLSARSLCPSFRRPLLRFSCISGRLPFLVPVPCLLTLSLHHVGFKSIAGCSICYFSSTSTECPERYGSRTDCWSFIKAFEANRLVAGNYLRRRTFDGESPSL